MLKNSSLCVWNLFMKKLVQAVKKVSAQPGTDCPQYLSFTDWTWFKRIEKNKAWKGKFASVHICGICYVQGRILNLIWRDAHSSAQNPLLMLWSVQDHSSSSLSSRFTAFYFGSLGRLCGSAFGSWRASISVLFVCSSVIVFINRLSFIIDLLELQLI